MSRKLYASGVVFATLAACAVFAPLAGATKYLDSSFGNPTNSIAASTGGLFDGPRGVAVNDDTGAVYVVDGAKHRIQQFDAANQFVRAWGQDVVGRNEQQTVRVTATAGTYTLSFGGNTTAAIAFNASASTVQTRLRALASIGSTGVTVSGGPGSASGSSPYTVTFTGPLAGTDVAELTADATALTGTVVIATTVTGAGGSGTGFEACTDATICKAGITTASTGGALNSPRGIAVNQSSGHVYVTDGGFLRVQEFTATGEFVRAWGQDVIANTATPPPNSNGTDFEICDTTAGNTAADCKAGVSGSVGGAFASTFVGYPAIVPAEAPNAGNVLVADPANQRVQEFTGTGEFVRAFGYDVVQPGGSGEAFGPLVNEIQQVTLPIGFSGPLTGTFRLSFAGQTTGAIAADAPASAVDAALEALPNVGPGGVSASGNDRGPYTVEFTGTLGLSDQPEMTGDNSGLDDGFGPGVFVSPITVATTRAGGPSPALEVCTVGAQCKAGVAGNGVGQFAANDPKRVAVDATGAIYTTDGGRTQKFTPQAGTVLDAGIFAEGSFAGTDPPSDLAFDAARNRMLIVARTILPAGSCAPNHPQSLGQAVVYEFTTAGAPTDSHARCTTIANQAGLAVSRSTGRLYLAAANVATGPNTTQALHRVWVLDDDGMTPAIATLHPATNVSASGADLSGTVDPNSIDNAFEPTNWRMEFSANGVDWRVIASGSLPAGTTPVPVSGSATGLRPNSQYRVRIVTTKPFGNPDVVSPEGTFLTDAVKPEIRTVASQDVTDGAATISARINPHSTPTSYRFEWGEGALDRNVPIPDGALGNGPDFIHVSQRLTGLEPGTTYQFRVIATSSSEGVTVGPTKTFTTSEAPVSPADRAYELVSPPDKLGGSGVGPWYAGVGSHGNAGFPAYTGDRFVSTSYLGAPLADGGFSYGTDVTLGDRTPAGWVNRPGFNRPGGFAHDFEFAKVPGVTAASDDLSLTAWGAASALRIFEEQSALPPLSGMALREWDSGRWEIMAPFAADQQVGNGSFAFHILAADGGYALDSGTLRGVAGAGDPTHPAYTGGPSDLVCPTETTCNASVYIDDVTAGLSNTFPGAGIRSLVNVCTGLGAARTTIPSVASGKIVAETCPAAPADRPEARLISPRGASIRGVSGLSAGAATDPMSADGARVVFMSPDHGRAANGAACTGTGPANTACPPQLYVRQRNTDGSVTTRWISRSAVPGQDASLLAAAIFEGMSRDGDKVFFRTASPLTADDPNTGGTCTAPCTTGNPSPTSVDLYMYDLPNGPDGDPSTADADPAGGALTRISAGPDGDGDGNVVTGDVTASGVTALRALADDGSRAYFVTAAPLPGVPPATDGTITTPGGTPSQSTSRNLYAYDAGRAPAERWRFIAQLPVQSALGECAATGSTPAQGPLYAGSNGSGANGAVQTFPGANCVRSTADGSFVSFFTDGRLTADDPDAVTGDVYAYDAASDELTRLSAPQGGFDGSYECVTDPGDSANLGTRCNGDLVIAGLTPPQKTLNLVSDPDDPSDRVTFFESAGRLVPEDHNDVYDVYQWRNGELSLLSTGAAGAEPALYRGNDRAGRNVYISTRDAWTWQDHDKVLDVYVARVGGGIPQPDPPPLCSLMGGDCQGPPAGGPVSVDVRSGDPSGQDVVARPRMRLALARPTKRALRRAARGGVLELRLRSDSAGTVDVVARARIGRKARKVGQSELTFSDAGAKTVSIRLSRAARKRLAATRRLRIRVTVAAPEERRKSLSVLLRRAGR